MLSPTRGQKVLNFSVTTPVIEIESLLQIASLIDKSLNLGSERSWRIDHLLEGEGQGPECQEGDREGDIERYSLKREVK